MKNGENGDIYINLVLSGYVNHKKRGYSIFLSINLDTILFPWLAEEYGGKSFSKFGKRVSIQ